MNPEHTPNTSQPGLLLIRHAQSAWNRQNRFTGWADPELTALGVDEAQRAARLLRDHGMRFDQAWSSELRRAGHTLDILLRETGQDDLPRQRDWRLNERHYGALQGADKATMMRQVGEAQVWRWRRGYLERPPAMSLAAWERQRQLLGDRVPVADQPRSETLADTRTRVARFYRERIAPDLARGARILVSAHGNTLRALLMELTDMSIAEVEAFEIPTATPIELDVASQDGRPPRITGWHYLEKETGRAVA